MVTFATMVLIEIVALQKFLPSWVRSSGGDVIAVLPIYGLAAVAWPRTRPAFVAAGTFGLAATIEFSQLYHAPAIDAIRGTVVGLLIGSTFVPSDFACYAIGVVAAFAFDTCVARRFHRAANA